MFEVQNIAGTQVLYVMAADAEYGAQLKQRIKPLMCGIGPVESAIVLTKTLEQLRATQRLPNIVVSLGSAGSNLLDQTGIYQASHVSYRDMDASPLGFEKGATPFLALPVQVPLPLLLPNVQTARLSTGANIVSGSAYGDIDADMVDMETFALMRCCQTYNIPLLAFRGISDGKDELTKISDWTEYLGVIDEKLAQIVDQLQSSIEADRLISADIGDLVD